MLRHRAYLCLFILLHKNPFKKVSVGLGLYVIWDDTKMEHKYKSKDETQVQ